MITVPTAFVLGAGASQPYGYPLGPDLLSGMTQGNFELRAFLMQLGFHKDVIDDFLESLLWCGLDSIDAYLARVDRHMEIGRLALAHQMVHWDSGRVNFSSDWLGYVWRRLIEGVNTPEEFAKNRLNIVTFNYDTSVERFITNAIKYTFDLTITKAIAFAKAIQIVHIYGSLPLVEGEKRLEPTQPTLEKVRQAAGNIIVLHEGKNDSQELRVARAVLAQAQVRIFLGFGFLEENVRRLRVNDWLRPGTQGAWGTTHGLTEGEKRRIRRLFPPAYPLTPLDGQCVDGVREWVDLFTA